MIDSAGASDVDCLPLTDPDRDADTQKRHSDTDAAQGHSSNTPGTCFSTPEPDVEIRDPLAHDDGLSARGGLLGEVYGVMNAIANATSDRAEIAKKLEQIADRALSKLADKHENIEDDRHKTLPPTISNPVIVEPAVPDPRAKRGSLFDQGAKTSRDRNTPPKDAPNAKRQTGAKGPATTVPSPMTKKGTER